MIIAFCHENVDPTRGGCETYIADLARRLLADRHEVHLLARHWNPTRLPRGLTVHPIVTTAWPRWLRPWLFGLACLNELNQFSHDVSVGFDKTWGQDVFYPQGGVYSASQHANFAKYPYPWQQTLARWLKRFDPAVRSFRLIEQLQYRRAQVIVVNSQMSRKHVEQYLSCPTKDVHVVHAAISPERFQLENRHVFRDRWRCIWGVKPQTVVGLFMAMNYRLKGLSPLLKAVRALPAECDFKLIIVGSPRFENFRSVAERYGIADRVYFHGFCADSRQMYFACDFLVHPTFYDPCSLVVLEALACGLPVITTRFNGAAELMNPPHDGVVIDNPLQTEALTEAIRSMLDRERREMASRAALESARQWTFEDHYRKMTAILEACCARKKPSRELQLTC